MKSWRDALWSTSRALIDATGADEALFDPLFEVAAEAGPSRDGSLELEWVTPNRPGRFGFTVFEHGQSRRHLTVARELCADLFDAAAVAAWDETLRGLRPHDVTYHVGLAWDDRRGPRIKLFLGNRTGISGAASLLGLAPHELIVGVGCDFWAGGRYRERRYFRAASFEALMHLAPRPEEGNAPAMSLPAGGHAVLTVTEPDDALGEKTTWSVIFPPHLAIDSPEVHLDEATREALTRISDDARPFSLRPSAFELDRYRDGREEREWLFTLGMAPR